MKRILLVVAALAVSGGIASADHRHGGWHGGGWHGGGGFRGGVVVTAPRYVSPRYMEPRVYVRPQLVRRPIYVQRPVIRYRYYDYDTRPTLIAENYPMRSGYYWVAGQWYWSGAEWIWQPGHYEPDPQYDAGYDDNTYYDGY